MINEKAIQAAAEAVEKIGSNWEGFAYQDAKTCIEAYFAACVPDITPQNKATQDQIASVMLQHGTEEQKHEVLKYISVVAQSVDENAERYLKLRERVVMTIPPLAQGHLSLTALDDVLDATPDSRASIAHPVPMSGPVAVKVFGLGTEIVVEGEYKGKPAVIIFPAKQPGEIGASSKREGPITDACLINAVVLVFPTDEQVLRVGDALVNVPPQAVVAQPVDFPYQKTFNAIAAATWSNTGDVAVSVQKFIEAFNAPEQSPQAKAGDKHD